MLKIGYIYELIDPRLPEVPRYIGYTKHSVESRLTQHISDALYYKKPQYKRNWIKNLLRQNIKPIARVLDTVSVIDMPFWEEYYISLYRSWGFKLLNLTPGGEGVRVFNRIRSKEAIEKHRLKMRGRKVSEETRCKISNTLMNHKCDDITRQKISSTLKGNVPWNKGKPYIQNRRAIIQLDFQGNKIAEFSSIKETKEKTGVNHVYDICVGRAKTGKGFIFKYKSDL